jgi:hypothetical protein
MSDEDTIQDIQENPYLQYFLGYSSYQFKPCFDPSLFVIPISRLLRNNNSNLWRQYVDSTSDVYHF